MLLPELSNRAYGPRTSQLLGMSEDQYYYNSLRDSPITSSEIKNAFKVFE